MSYAWAVFRVQPGTITPFWISSEHQIGIATIESATPGFVPNVLTTQSTGDTARWNVTGSPDSPVLTEVAQSSSSLRVTNVQNSGTSTSVVLMRGGSPLFASTEIFGGSSIGIAPPGQIYFGVGQDVAQSGEIINTRQFSSTTSIQLSGNTTTVTFNSGNTWEVN
ncbi:MAG: hypothetical protein GY927_09100 [bacterium]|nr:hypothetical protein [bacterium]